MPDGVEGRRYVHFPDLQCLLLKDIPQFLSNQLRLKTVWPDLSLLCMILQFRIMIDQLTAEIKHQFWSPADPNLFGLPPSLLTLSSEGHCFHQGVVETRCYTYKKFALIPIQ